MVLDTWDKKVKEAILVLLACPLYIIHLRLWRKENQEPLEPTAFLASLVLEVTRACQVCLVVRVCLDFLVWLTKLKDSRDSQGFLDDQELQAFLGQKVKQESWDSPARLDQGAMMVRLVCQVTLENLVGLEAKVNLEMFLPILELQELKA